MNCPSCHSKDVRLIGKIPSTDRFAGRWLPEPMDGGMLYRCNVCYFYYRHPRPSQQTLQSLYSAGAIDNWNTKAEFRNDWKIISSWIKMKSSTGSKILDVGCFDGRFLEFVGEGYRRFGIELHEKARKIAQAKGVKMVGADFSGIEKMTGQYDVITAIDVIEHVPNPYDFLANLSRVTCKGGLIIVSSGDTESVPWRIARSRYYYCTIAEHISFINVPWCRVAASRLGLELIQIGRFSHSRAGLTQRAREMGKNMLYILFPAVAAGFRAKGFGGKDVKLNKELLDHPPAWPSARDHLAVVLKKL